jgi:hypothetical protein
MSLTSMALHYPPFEAQTSWAAYVRTINAMKVNNLQQSTLTTNRPLPSGPVNGDDSEDAAHCESPPPSDCNPEVVKPMPAPFVLGRHPIDMKQNEMSNGSLFSTPGPQLLPVNEASPGEFDESCGPTPGHVRGVPPVFNLCVCGCIRTTGRGSLASDNAVYESRMPVTYPYSSPVSSTSVASGSDSS